MTIAEVLRAPGEFERSPHRCLSQDVRYNGRFPQERRLICEAGLIISGGDDVVKALMDPVTLAQEIYLGPSTRDLSELSVAWNRTHQ